MKIKKLLCRYNVWKDPKPTVDFEDLSRRAAIPGNGVSFVAFTSEGRAWLVGGNVNARGRVYLLAWFDSLGGETRAIRGKKPFEIRFDAESVAIVDGFGRNTAAVRLRHRDLDRGSFVPARVKVGDPVVATIAARPSYFEDVGEFNRKFGLPVQSAGREAGLLDDETFLYKHDHLDEELREVLRAHRNGDLVGFADGLVDLVYVAVGTAHFAGIPFDAVWDEVQAANMRKVRASGADDPRGKRGHGADVVKPEGWEPPDVADAIRRGGSRSNADIVDMTSADDAENAAVVDDGFLRLSTWDRRFLALARHVATWSKDPSEKVGAVVVAPGRREIAFGYNGFPPGIEDSDDRLEDRDARHRLTQHAERNALDNARFDVRGTTLYSTFFVCSDCAKSVVTKGVTRVVCPAPPDREPWASDALWTRTLFCEAGIDLVEVDAT